MKLAVAFSFLVNYTIPHPHCAEHRNKHFFYDIFVEGIGSGGESGFLDLKVFLAEFGEADPVGTFLNAVQRDFFFKGFYEGVDLLVELLVGEVGLGGLENFRFADRLSCRVASATDADQVRSV